MATEPGSVVAMGVGGVGGVIASRLAVRGGVQVTCVDQWDEHVRKINEEGLRHHHAQEEVQVARVDARLLQVFARAVVPESVKFALLACKSQDTSTYLDALEPALAPDGLVVSLQNGLNEVDIASCVGARRTIGAVVLLDGELEGPGRVRSRRSPARLKIGAWEGDGQAPSSTATELIGLLRSGVDVVEWSTSIRHELATKLVKNCVINAATAICDCAVATLFRDDGLRPFIACLVHECAAVMARAGYSLGSDVFFGLDAAHFISEPTPGSVDAFWRAAQELFPTDVEIVSSMLHDVRVHRPTEIAALNGRVVEVGRAVGVRTPLNDLLVALIGRIEAEELCPGQIGRAELLRAFASEDQLGMSTVMGSSDEATIAEDLFSAFFNKETYYAKPAFDALDDVAATRVRDLVCGLRRQRLGDRIAGYKIALTTPPIVGYIFHSDVARDDASVALTDFLDPYLEPEVVFEVRDELPPDATPEEMFRQCDAWIGIEIADSRVENWFAEKTRPRLLADNCAAGRFIVGARFRDGLPEELSTQFTLDGQRIGVGQSRREELLDNLRMVAFEAEHTGRPLQRGQVIFSGTLTRPAQPLMTGRYEVVVNGTTRVGLTVAS